jgi:hypothetical protein
LLAGGTKKRQQEDIRQAKANWRNYRKRKTARDMMALTKDFRETIRERAQREPRFRRALLREAIELMLSGDEKTGRAIEVRPPPPCC